MSSIDLRLGDCLEIMPTLPAQSFDAIIADIPYGTTACKWDTVIPFAPMWENLKRLAKPRAAIVLFGSQPFTSALVMSNIEMFKYAWVWDKKIGANIGHARRMPLRTHEDIAVFCDTTPIYNPQFHDNYTNLLGKYTNKKSETAALSSKVPRLSGQRGFPRTVIQAMRPNNLTGGGFHPTQKPVALMEYLIRTYTNEGDTVLDFTMGSGTTMVACVNTNRNGVGIEKEQKYFEIAQRRIAEVQAQTEKEKHQLKQKELL